MNARFNKLLLNAIDTYNASITSSHNYLKSYQEFQEAMKLLSGEQAEYTYCELLLFKCRLALSIPQLDQAQVEFASLKQRSHFPKETQMTAAINDEIKSLEKKLENLNDHLANQAAYQWNYALLVDDVLEKLEAKNDVYEYDDENLNDLAVELLGLTDNKTRIQALERAIDSINMSKSFYNVRGLREANNARTLKFALKEKLADAYVDLAATENISAEEKTINLKKANLYYASIISKHVNKGEKVPPSLYLSQLNILEELAKANPDETNEYISLMKNLIKDNALETLIESTKNDEERQQSQNVLQSHKEFFANPTKKRPREGDKAEAMIPNKKPHNAASNNEEDEVVELLLALKDPEKKVYFNTNATLFNNSPKVAPPTVNFDFARILNKYLSTIAPQQNSKVYSQILRELGRTHRKFHPNIALAQSLYEKSLIFNPENKQTKNELAAMKNLPPSQMLAYRNQYQNMGNMNYFHNAINQYIDAIKQLDPHKQKQIYQQILTQLCHQQFTKLIGSIKSAEEIQSFLVDANKLVNKETIAARPSTTYSKVC